MRNKFTAILSCILLALFFGCVIGGVIAVLKFRVPVREEYNVMIPDEIELYADEQVSLAPYLINKNGETVQARFEYESSDPAVRISKDGLISVVSTPRNDVYITVKDKNTSAVTTVKVKVEEGLKSVKGLVIRSSDGRRTAYTGKQKLELISGEKVTLEVITSGGNVEIEDFTSLAAVDVNGSEKHVFDCAYAENEIGLTAVGLGTGYLRLKLTDKRNGLLYDASVGFTITMPNAQLSRDVLAYADATLLSLSEIESMRTVAVSATEIDLSELSGLKSLKTVVFTAGSEVVCTNISAGYNYCFKSELLSDYVNSEVWAEHVNRLFPYDNEYAEGDVYVVLHNDEPSADCPVLDYFKVSARAQLPVYGKTGRVVSGWIDSESYACDNERLQNLQAPGVHLYAVWLDTPTDWFSYEITDGRQYVTALTEEWENCSDVLDKSYLYLPDSNDGMAIYGIGEGAFAGNAEIRRVLIPSTIEYISDNAFKGCNQLAEVVGAENIAYVGKDAFTGTEWLNGFNEQNSFLVLGKVAVKYCATGGVAVSESDFPEGVTSLGYGAFRNCGAAGGSIVIPERITAVYDEAFTNSGFTDFTLQSGIKFGRNVFGGVTVNSFTVRSNEFDFSTLLEQTESLSVTEFIITSAATSLNVNAQSNVTVGTFSASDLSLSTVSITGFKNIETLNLYNNKITSLALDGSVTGTLNLTNNSLSSLNLNKIYAAKLMLAGNALTSITCSLRNEYVKIIYMPSEGAQNKNKITSLAFTANTPNLVSLDVANNNVSEIGGLETLKNLRELYLGGNGVLGNNTQMSKINNTDFCSKLVRLNLGGVSSNTAGILEIVRKSTNLEWLQIYGIGASSSQITNAIKQSTHAKLTYIKISHNGFSTVPGGLNYIKKVVIDYDDTDQG